MKNTNKKIGLLVLIMLLGTYNSVMAENAEIDILQIQDIQSEKIKANKDTLNKAQESINNKDFQTAINYMTAYINSKPKKYEPYKLRGDAYYALRRYDLAKSDYQTAVDLKTEDDKVSTSTKYISAIILGADKNEQLQNTSLGDLYGALMYAQKAQNDSAYATSYENAIKYNSHIYLPQPKKEDINKINCPQKYGKILNPKGIDEKIYGAINDIENANFNEATYKLQSVTSEYPNYYLGHYLTGVALAGLEKDNEAIHSFEKAITLNPYDFESYASLGQIYFEKAETTFSEADAKKSIEYFNKALRLNKDCPTYYFYIGMNELQIGNTNVAIYNFDKALKYNSADYNSMYYKLIAQYINGDYRQVVDGSTKLLYRHVSNYNSVMYLRALAYTKLNENQRALQDLNTIENNIEDIYNNDIKEISSREKSLESYIHYLKSEIQHSQGAGSASDNTQAYSNPIINRLANAKKAIEPYEKSLSGETISANDYRKFEYFYSTSLPKLLESGAIISYDDIDNQYDYIRTTFDDLGVSFIYNYPNYKITTIKDYPYKKYSSKLSQTDMNSLKERPLSEVRNVELQKAQNTILKKSTPQSEMLAKSGEQSLAQMLATNALSERTKEKTIITDTQPTSDISTLSDIKNDISKASFTPENPDGERVNTAKNIASGELYENKTPLVNETNSQNLKNILDEEKSITNDTIIFKTDKFQQTPDLIIRTNKTDETQTVEQEINSNETQTAEDGTIKISAREIKNTPDIIIRHETQRVISPTYTQEAEVSEQTKQTMETVADTSIENTKSVLPNQLNESMKFTAEEIKQTDDIVIRYPDVKPVTSIIAPAKTVTQETTEALTEVEGKVAETTETVAELTPKAAKEAKKEAEKLAKAEAKKVKETAKEAKKLAKAEAKKAKEAAKEAEKLAEIETENTTKEAKKLAKAEAKKAKELALNETKEKDILQETKTAYKTADNRSILKEKINNANTTIEDKITQVEENISKVAEKHANINSSDYGVQNKTLIIDDYSDVVELNTENLNRKFGVDSDLFKNDRISFKAADTNAISSNIETPAVTLSEETVQSDKLAENKAETMVVTVPEIYSNKQDLTKETTVTIPAEVQVQPTIQNEPEIIIPEITTSNATTNKEELIKEKLSDMIDEIIPKKQESVNEKSMSPAEEKLAETINQAEAIKAERIRLEEEAKLAKVKAKAQAKAEKQKLKEASKLAKEKVKAEKLAQKGINISEQKKAKEAKKFAKAQAKTEKLAQKEQLKAQKATQAAQAKAEKFKAKEETKFQKQLAKEQAQFEKSQISNENSATIKAKIEKAQRAEQKELEKAAKEQAKQAKKLAKEQAKQNSETDEIKVQLLKAKQDAKEAKQQTKAEQKALKEQLKAERKQAQQEFKAKKAMQKTQEEQLQSQKENSKFSFKNVFSKIKFWNKNK